MHPRCSLVKADVVYKKEIIEMIKEWSSFLKINSKANASPAAIFRYKVQDFSDYVKKLNRTQPEPGFVPESTFFLLDEEEKTMIGAISIRHKLNEYLENYGGHIGYGIRPSKGNKGYGSIILGLGLEKAKELGLKNILLFCAKENTYSKKIILHHGGIFEQEVFYEGAYLEKYFLEIRS